MSDSPDKVRRQRAIRSVVRQESVPNQQGLARLLARRGIEVTQATLSRDLKELRMLRVPDDGGYRYVEAVAEESGPSYDAEAKRMHSVASLEVTGIDANESCVVVRTLTGRAQGVAVWLDGLGVTELLATIAGDDSILVVPRSTRNTERLRSRLAAELGLEAASRPGRGRRGGSRAKANATES